MENAWRHNKTQLKEHAPTHDVFIRNLANQLCQKQSVTLSNGDTATISANSKKWREKHGLKQLARQTTSIEDNIDVDADDELAELISEHVSDDGTNKRNCKWCYRVHGLKRGTKNLCIECPSHHGIDAPLCNEASTRRPCFRLHEKYGFPSCPLSSDQWRLEASAKEKIKWEKIRNDTAEQARCTSPQGASGRRNLAHTNAKRKAEVVMRISVGCSKKSHK